MRNSIPMLFLAHGGHSAFAFLRALLAARLLGVEDFGIAASFAIVVAAVEAVTALGIPQFMLRAQDGDDPRLQEHLQSLLALKGLFGAILLFLFAPTIARTLSLSDFTSVFQCLSFVPLLAGLQSLDLVRAQRSGNFTPLAKCHILSGTFGLLALLIGYAVFPDPRAMLIAIIGQSLAACLISHRLAERRFDVKLSLATTRDLLSFGLPLMANGILLFFVLHGEKLVIARFGTLEMLGLFTLGLTLSVMPASVVDKALQALFLPRLAATKDRPTQMRQVGRIAWTAAGLGLGMSALLAAAAPLASIAFGSEFAGLSQLLIFFAALAALRILRSAVVTCSIAIGRTGVAALSNLPRLVGLAAAAALLLKGGALPELLMLGVAFEASGLALSIVLLARAGTRYATIFALPCLTVLAGWAASAIAPGFTALTLFTLGLLRLVQLRWTTGASLERPGKPHSA